MPRIARQIIESAVLVLLLAAAGAAFAAKTYRWVDAQGVIHYSDTPQPGAQQVDLPPAQTYKAPPVAVAAPAAPAAPDADATAPYESCAITAPAADAALFAPESVHVAVHTVPGLRPGDVVQVLLDGSPLGAPGVALEFDSTQPDRGAHTVTAAVRDSDGRVVCSASPVTFYVQRPSLLSPQSPARGH